MSSSASAASSSAGVGSGCRNAPLYGSLKKSGLTKLGIVEISNNGVLNFFTNDPFGPILQSYSKIWSAVMNSSKTGFKFYVGDIRFEFIMTNPEEVTLILFVDELNKCLAGAGELTSTSPGSGSKAMQLVAVSEGERGHSGSSRIAENLAKDGQIGASPAKMSRIAAIAGRQGVNGNSTTNEAIPLPTATNPAITNTVATFSAPGVPSPKKRTAKLLDCPRCKNGMPKFTDGRYFCEKCLNVFEATLVFKSTRDTRSSSSREGSN